MARKRNAELLAEIERIADIKLQIPTSKQLAQKHGVHPCTVRHLISEAMERKLAKVAHL
jgi:hypothetical protein